MPAEPSRVRFFAEILGLSPPGLRLRQAWFALRGEADVPGSRFGLSSLRQLRPRIAPPLWFGRPFLPRTVLVTNLFNHRQTPIEAGWSVRRTQVEDFRGRGLSYDSHNGTDFAIPVRTAVHTAAAGEVVRVVSEFNRGGLKVFVDHGGGLITAYAHLARACVQEGDLVHRGQLIARSGYSGLDGFVTFPFGVPHVHLNVWLNGEPVDPFGHGRHASLWRTEPPTPAADADPAFEPDAWDEAGVTAAIEACRPPQLRARLAATEPLARRAAHTIIERNYYPTRFDARPPLQAVQHPRTRRLDLPFSGADFDSVVFADDLGRAFPALLPGG